MSLKVINKLHDILETWVVKAPTEVSQIRVYANNFYHHGIYISDDEVIEFSNGTVDLQKVENILIQKTTLADFVGTKTVFEVREYSRKERKLLQEKSVIINDARNRIGEYGYDFLHNNCEHFSNDCFFKISYSRQFDVVRKMVASKLK